MKRLFFGAAALSMARMFQLVVSFLTVPVMARLLEPHDFGLFAVGLAIVSLSLAFSDAGMSRSLVRADEADVVTWSSAHWLIVGVTGLTSLILIALSWPASRFFELPGLVPVMVTLALLPLIQGFLELPVARLLKRENFAPMAIADFTSAIAAAVAAITFGFAGLGVWALVAQYVAYTAVRAPIILIAAKFQPRLTFKWSALADHIKFARDTLGYSLTNVVARQIDPLVIGKFLNATSLGLYTVAFRLISLPAGIVGGPVQTALYPRIVKLRDKPEELRALMLAATMAQASLVFPPMAALAVGSHAFFTILLSERWSAAAIIFTALALGGVIQTISAFNSSMLQAIGRTGERLRLTVEFSILWAVTAPILAQFNVLTIAIGFSVVSLIYLPRLAQVFARAAGCSMADYAKAFAAPVLVSLAIMLTHVGITSALHLSNWAELALAGLETAAGYGVLFYLGRRQLERDLHLMRSILSPG